MLPVFPLAEGGSPGVVLEVPVPDRNGSLSTAFCDAAVHHQIIDEAQSSLYNIMGTAMSI